MFAFSRHNVYGIDVNKEVVNTINSRNIHIEKSGLGDMVEEIVKAGRIKASLASEKANILIIVAPTHNNNNDGYKSCDLSYI